jgi:uncharacterized protein (DUF885 family)
VREEMRHDVREEMRVGANEAAGRLADGLWEDLLVIDPLIGTSIGDERFDDRLPDPGPEGRAREEAVFRSALADLATIDRGSLDDDLRLTMDMLEAVCGRYLATLEHRTDRLVAANHLLGPSTMLGDLASLQRADTPERLERYQARLHGFPAFLAAWSEVAREAVAARVTAPRVVVERSVAQLDRLLALAPEDSPALMPVGDDPAVRERVASIVDELVNPAHAAFLEVLRHDYLPRATESIGLSGLPDGGSMYGAEILAWTSLPMDPRDVHQLGLERFAAIQDERFAIAAALGYEDPNAAVADHGANGGNTASSPEQLVRLAEGQVTRSWELAPNYFGVMPSSNCEVRRVEPFREADMPFAYYQPPTEDGSRPGIYYINAYDLANRPLHHTAAVTYHEANPGHHFQIAIEQELPDRLPLRRYGGNLAAASFAEGWGLYSERLADEMGLYLDGWEHLGMLEAQALRAARLITDTGIHALDWERESAIAKLEEAGSPRIDAEIEIDRYIAMPGQALSYMVGMIEIERAREAARTREGASFSLKAFHDRVLSLGQLPLPALRRELGSG